MRNAEPCACGRGLIPLLGRMVCPECSQFPSQCRCWRLSKAAEPTQEQLDEWEHAVQHGGVGDLIGLAQAWAEGEPPVLLDEWFVRISMRDADWCDEAIDEAVESIGEKRVRDVELHPERVEVNSTSMWSPPSKAKGGDPNNSTSDGGAKEIEIMANGASKPPIETFLGIGLWNQAAAMLAQKVGNDLSNDKLDTSKHEDRMEILGWTALILVTENVLVPMGFALRNTLPRLISQASGKPVEVPGQGAKAGGISF